MKGTSLVLAVLVMLAAGLAVAQGAPAAAQEKLPASLQRVTGNPAFSYAAFAVLAGIAVLLIYRGIRAR
jgi:Na+/phosphate symporter